MQTTLQTRPEAAKRAGEAPGAGRTVLLLGGYGNAGRAIGETALEWLGINLIVAGRDGGRARAWATELQARFGAARVESMTLDAQDDRSLRQALARTDL